MMTPGIHEMTPTGIPAVPSGADATAKRDWFAAIAMSAIITSSGMVKPHEAAERAVQFADALIIELDKSK